MSEILDCRLQSTTSCPRHAHWALIGGADRTLCMTCALLCLTASKQSRVAHAAPSAAIVKPQHQAVWLAIIPTGGRGGADGAQWLSMVCPPPPMLRPWETVSRTWIRAAALCSAQPSWAVALSECFFAWRRRRRDGAMLVWLCRPISVLILCRQEENVVHSGDSRKVALVPQLVDRDRTNNVRAAAEGGQRENPQSRSLFKTVRRPCAGRIQCLFPMHSDPLALWSTPYI
ncbi:hypothetical protein BDZ91DRAFT_725939 [Kalaharituber pfeilii]|nr:hypothetical protein BDZ91DRAFT_725939 [Kalaharituber pfeilii]